MILIIFLSTLLIPPLLLYVLHASRRPTKSLDPPGPPGLPLIGNMHQLAAAKTPHVYLWRLSKKYGPIVRMNLGPKPLIVVSSAKLAEKVMKTQDLAFCSRPESLGRQRLSYNCSDIAFSPYNDYWREVRKITTVHLFNINKALSFRPVREDEISRAVCEISGFAARNQVLNMSETVMALGATLTCRIAFGKRYSGDGNDMRRFDELMKRIQGLLAGFFVSDYFLRLGWVDRLCGSIGRLERTFEDLDSFYQELIDEHLDPNKPETMAGDILDTLIQLKQNRSTSVDLSWDNIKALLLLNHCSLLEALLTAHASCQNACSMQNSWDQQVRCTAPHDSDELLTGLFPFFGGSRRFSRLAMEGCRRVPDRQRVSSWWAPVLSCSVQVVVGSMRLLCPNTLPSVGTRDPSTGNFLL
ncbi:Cytochrome P450 83B1 [Striga hermonthica]|uniref:Cytochrome P450 83B1 n=1 Tax=Striga hermonthica TaxID=68872 RepID=A0A9N7RNH5_STRHE|nr:Cytochrome P450 83B1 [Striga hermonthica]